MNLKKEREGDVGHFLKKKYNRCWFLEHQKQKSVGHWKQVDSVIKYVIVDPILKSSDSISYV
jgi:hypothetical protein